MSLLALDDDLGTVPSGRSRCIRSRARASSRRIRSRARASSRRIRSRRSVPRASPLPCAAPELANLIAPVRTCFRERTQRPAFLGTQEEISVTALSRRTPRSRAAYPSSGTRTPPPGVEDVEASHSARPKFSRCFRVCTRMFASAPCTVDLILGAAPAPRLVPPVGFQSLGREMRGGAIPQRSRKFVLILSRSWRFPG